MYYYDVYIYSIDNQKGLYLLEIRDPRVANGKAGKYPADFNPQSQPTY